MELAYIFVTRAKLQRVGRHEVDKELNFGRLFRALITIIIVKRTYISMDFEHSYVYFPLVESTESELTVNAPLLFRLSNSCIYITFSGSTRAFLQPISFHCRRLFYLESERVARLSTLPRTA